jgi:glycosyltransferase involved in cell wall biosynthesis
MADLVCYIPSYNDSEWVRESLASLADWQVVISDNASCEPHREALRALAGGRVKVIRQEKSLGRVGNWQFCIDHFIHSGARWMKFLCAGDRHKPNSRDIFLRAIQRHPSARHIVPRIDNVWPHGRETWSMTSKEGLVSPQNIMAAIAEFGNVFHGLIAPLFHVDAVKNGFTFGEETMDFCADLMFSMNLARHAPTLYVTEVSAEFIAARRKSMQAGLYTLEHLLEEGLMRLRAADTFFELSGDYDRRNRLLAGIASWMREGLNQPLERLTGDVAFPFELLAVDTRS